MLCRRGMPILTGDDRLRPGDARPSTRMRIADRANVGNGADHRQSGTGKEFVARAIHAASHRHGTPMVSLNCPVLSAHLMESGPVRPRGGPYRGRRRDRPLRGGPRRHDPAGRGHRDRSRPAGQVLRRVAGEIVRAGRLVQDAARQRPRAGHDEPRFARRGLGGTFPRGPLLSPGRVATDRSAAPPAPRGRAGTGCLLLPAIRPARAARECCALEPATAQLLVDYHWPGNVRELENIITRASVLTTTGGA